MPYKVIVDRNICIGCGACVSTCDNFQLIDGKSHPKKEIVKEIGCNKAAEETCPVSAITVEEIK